MNKFNITVLIIILSVFGLIVYSTQKDTFGKSGNKMTQVPSIPPGDKLELLTGTPVNNNQPSNQKQSQQQQVQGQQAPPAEIQGPINASVSATIKTSKGDIAVILFGKEAQKTVANFITKSKSGFYKNLAFHRVEDWVIQGGDPTGQGTGGGAIQTELNAQPFIVGSLGMAASSSMQSGQGARISNDSQFFITTKEATWLDGQYTNFGIVTRGMDVVNRIKIGDKILGITIE